MGWDGSALFWGIRKTRSDEFDSSRTTWVRIRSRGGGGGGLVGSGGNITAVKGT